MRCGAGAADGEERRPLFRASERESRYLLVVRALTRMLDCLTVELALSVRLLMARLQLFLFRAFMTVEDFRLAHLMPVGPSGS